MHNIKEYSVDIDLINGEQERELNYKSFEKAKKIFDKYAQTMIYDDEQIDNIQLVAVFKNGDYESLDVKFSDY